MNRLKDLNKYLEGFLGYGSKSPKIIFVGMEEGGGETLENIETRLKIWPKYNQSSLVPLKDFSIDLGYQDFFKNNPRSQITWRALIKILLSIEKKDTSLNSVKEFQKNKLGAQRSNHALIELMPLPSPSTNKWPYSTIDNLPFLSSRESYFNYLIEKRINLLKAYIDSSNPQLVLFYSYTYLEHWEKISDTQFNDIQPNDFLYGKNDNTHFVISKHPASFVRKQYFEDIGTFLKSILS